MHSMPLGLKSNGLGGVGEDLAAVWLKKNGYKIIERNYRCKLGEIDCVAVKDDFLVFIEVKSRKSINFGTPMEAVDRRKRRKMTRLAFHYMLDRRMGETPRRFDVVAVWFNDGPPVVEVFENAFDAEE